MTGNIIAPTGSIECLEKQKQKKLLLFSFSCQDISSVVAHLTKVKSLRTRHAMRFLLKFSAIA
jgi:hypothetical protein